jgi:RimJ/RimL family protein N-acetyltransferase
MDVLTFTDAAAFAPLVHPVIDRHPEFANILASNLDQTLHGPALETYWFLIRDGEEPVGAAMYTPGSELFLTPLPETSPDAAGPGPMTALAEALLLTGQRPAWANGPLETVSSFAGVWEERNNVTGRITQSTRLYGIGSRPQPAAALGAARPATEADLGWAAGWVRQFDLDAQTGRSPEHIESTLARRLARGRLLLWESGGTPVSMAGISRPVAGVARVGGVYTPKEHRRRGFAAAVTVAATRQGFDDGAARCILYTDLANPTSNGIYQSIGYRPIGDGAKLAFDR